MTTGIVKMVLSVIAISSLGCVSARGPDADRHAKLLIHLTVEGALFSAYSQSGSGHW